MAIEHGTDGNYSSLSVQDNAGRKLIIAHGVNAQDGLSADTIVPPLNMRSLTLPDNSLITYDTAEIGLATPDGVGATNMLGSTSAVHYPASNAGPARTRQYRYDNDSAHKYLTSIVDERGIEYVSWSYVSGASLTCCQ